MSYMPAGASNTMPGSRQRMSAKTTGGGVADFTGAGAPAANALAGTCAVGDRYTDTTGGKLYICTATNGTTTSTWVSVGSQT
jgi:hypothetical protein